MAVMKSKDKKKVADADIDLVSLNRNFEIEIIEEPKYINAKSTYDPLEDIDRTSILLSDFNIESYMHICDLNATLEGKIRVTNINPEYKTTHSTHDSWLYFITLNGFIAKIGESSTVLLDLTRGTCSESRINRLSGYNEKHDTDRHVRTAIYPYLVNGDQVAYYAVPLPTPQCQFKIGSSNSISLKCNSQAEIQAHNEFEKVVGTTPPLNRNKK